LPLCLQCSCLIFQDIAAAVAAVALVSVAAAVVAAVAAFAVVAVFVALVAAAFVAVAVDVAWADVISVVVKQFTVVFVFYGIGIVSVVVIAAFHTLINLLLLLFVGAVVLVKALAFVLLLIE